jgi:ribosomal protein L7/L12
MVETITLAEEMPSTVLKDLSKWKAERIKRKLENSGLEVEVRKQ